MNMIQSAKDQIAVLTRSAYRAAVQEGLLPDGVETVPAVEIPKDTANGDYTTTFCLAASKAMRKNPREVANILSHATGQSLLILDEIGRGTSTFDGMSIARAVLEFCADPKKLGAKTLFATHYHELTELEGILPGVKNYSISIKKRGDELIFLRKIVPGGADRSYGIEVAKLAGLPNEVVKRANIILKELEQGGAYQAKPREETEQVSLDAIGEAEVLAAIRRAQPDTMSPIEAMQLLYELKQKLS